MKIYFPPPCDGTGVGCVGSEGVLCECPSNGVANSNCRTMGDAGVVCKSEPTNPIS